MPAVLMVIVILALAYFSKPFPPFG